MDILLKFNAWQLRCRRGNDLTLANFNLTPSRLSSLGTSNRPSWYLPARPHSITTQRDVTDDSARDWFVWTPAETGNSTEIYISHWRKKTASRTPFASGTRGQRTKLWAFPSLRTCFHLPLQSWQTALPYWSACFQSASSPYVSEPSGILFNFRYATYFGGSRVSQSV